MPLDAEVVLKRFDAQAVVLEGERCRKKEAPPKHVQTHEHNAPESTYDQDRFPMFKCREPRGHRGKTCQIQLESIVEALRMRICMRMPRVLLIPMYTCPPGSGTFLPFSHFAGNGRFLKSPLSCEGAVSLLTIRTPSVRFEK